MVTVAGGTGCVPAEVPQPAMKRTSEQKKTGTEEQRIRPILAG